MKVKTYVWTDAEYMGMIFQRLFIGFAIIFFFNIGIIGIGQKVLGVIINLIMLLFTIIILISYSVHIKKKRKLEEIKNVKRR